MRCWMSIVLVLGLTAAAVASPPYVGHSGAPGRQSCAYSCHGGNNNGTVTISGFPTEYTPAQSYEVTITRSSGSSINNFNASCRVGTGTVNAGTLSAGTGTVTYNTSGETNGIHLSSNNQTSATFNWTAPAAGTGSVVLYVAAHQGTSAGGANTEIVSAADEAVATPPEPATNPCPADSATAVPLDAVCTWTAGAGASGGHTVAFGNTNPPMVYGTQAAATFDPPGDLMPNTVYYWQIGEENTVGTTHSPLWSFTTQGLPDTAIYLEPYNNELSAPAIPTLRWHTAALADSYVVYLDETELPAVEIYRGTDTLYALTAALTPGQTYYWRVDAINHDGVTVGPVWNFRVGEIIPVDPSRASGSKDAALGLVYPNPFNAIVTVPFSLPKSAEVKLALYDVTGRQVAVLASGVYGPGDHRLEWSADGYATGVYLLRLTTGKKVLTTKITAIK